MAKIKHEDLIEDGLFAPSIKEAKDFLKVLESIKSETKNLLKGFSELANATPLAGVANIKQVETAIKGGTKAVETLTAAEKEEVKIKQQIIAMQAKLAASTKDEAVASEELKIQLAAQTKANKDLAKEKLGLVGAYEQESKRLNELRKSYKDLAVAGQGNTKEAKALKKEINELDSSLKKVDDSVGQNQRSVGKYENALKSIVPSLSGMATGILEAVKASLAFIATPLGAVLAVIASATALVVSAFKAFKPVTDALEQGVSALGAAFDVVQNAVVALITGTKSLSAVFSNLGDDISAAAKAAVELKKAQQDLEDLKAAQSVSDAKAKRQIDELLLQSKNRTKSEQERARYIEEALAIEEKNYLQRKKIADEDVRQAREALILKGELNKKEVAQLTGEGGVLYARQKLQGEGKRITDEEIQKYADALVAQETLLDESVSLREKAQNRLDVLLDKQEANAEKRRAEAKAKAEKDAEAKAKAQEEFQKQTDEESQRVYDVDRTNTERRLALMEEGRAKQEAIENDRYQQELVAARIKGEDLELVERIHLKNMQKIAEEDKKKNEDLQKEYKRQRDERKSDAIQAGKDERAAAELDYKNTVLETTDAIIESYKKRSDFVEHSIDSSIEQSKRAQDYLKQQAIAGTKNAAESLAFEQEQQAKLEQKKLQQQKKKQREELALTTLKTYQQKLNSSDPKVSQHALAKTISDITLLETFIANLPAFFEGVEDTGGRGDLDSKGGKLAILHPHERVMTAEQNKKIGSLSNNEVSNLAFEYNNRRLFVDRSLKTNDILAEKLDKIHQSIAEKPVYLGRDYDASRREIIETIEQKGRIERNHYKKSWL